MGSSPSSAEKPAQKRWRRRAEPLGCFADRQLAFAHQAQGFALPDLAPPLAVAAADREQTPAERARQQLRISLASAKLLEETATDSFAQIAGRWLRSSRASACRRNSNARR